MSMLCYVKVDVHVRYFVTAFSFGKVIFINAQLGHKLVEKDAEALS